MPIRTRGRQAPRIDREAILNKEFEELDPHERRWLQDTDWWPEGEPKEPVTFLTHTGQMVSNDPAFLMREGVGNNEVLKRMIESRARDIAQDLFNAQSHQMTADAQGEYTGNALPGSQPGTQPPPANAKLTNWDDLDVPEPDDMTIPYDQMGIKELRGEALRRGLSIDGEDGKKSGNLISNIEAWDEAHPEGVEAWEQAQTGEDDESEEEDTE